MYSARGILMHPAATEFHKSQIQNILYVAYEKWAIKQALTFKRFHSYKCRDISHNELILAGKWGLFKSTVKYNGSSTFISYAEIYIHSELLRFMNSRLKGTRTGSMEYPDLLESDMKPSIPPLDITSEIEFHDAATKRMFYIKYADSPRSNRAVAELMCCSEETVRQKLGKISPNDIGFQ